MAFEAVQALYVWPRPVVQDSRAIDQNIAVVVDGPLALLYLNLPFALLAVPDCRSDLGIVPHVPVEVVLLLYPNKVVLDLTTSSIEA